MIVRKLRIERGWTQEHLAQLAGLSVRSIQRIERGASCSLETRNALAAVFEVGRSMLDSGGAASNEAAPPADSAAIAYVGSLKGFLSHAYLFGVLSIVAGLAFELGRPAVLWCLMGWAIGLLVHGLTAFGFLTIFSTGWEREQLEKRATTRSSIDPEKWHWTHRRPVAVLERFIQSWSASMKKFSQLSGSVVFLTGAALLAWVSYDATKVMQSLGLEARMDEATVAVLSLSLGAVLVASGIYVWRRLARTSDATSA